MPIFVAADLGAETGRVLRGTLDGGRLEVGEVHRFVNRPVALPQGLHWDVLAPCRSTRPVSWSAMEGSAQLEVAERLAMLPDLFEYWLSGRLVTEQTIASTSQLLDVVTRRWAAGVIEALGIPGRLFTTDVVSPGTRVGSLLTDRNQRQRRVSTVE